MDRKTNIQICSDQELVEMFAKHKDSRRCLLSVSYHSPDSEPPPEIPQWEFSATVHSIEAPFTPSMPCPSLAQPSIQTHTESVDTDFLANPNPSFEHVGVDEEGLYIDMGPQNPVPDASNKQGQSEDSESETCHESDSAYESLSDAEIEDIDEIVIDREPAQKPEVDYDKNDPPMAVGTLYSDMDAFKLALASHATKYEFNYAIEKSDKSRYRVYCSGKEVGCRWRLHASTLKDGTVQVKRNPHSHDGHHSTRREGSCVGVTKFWVCEQVIDWLKEDGNLGAKFLRKKLNELHKIDVTYRKVYLGKHLAMGKLYGPWDKSFDNLYRFKAQIEESSPDSFVVIDHHTINNKIRFNRLFFALKACIDGFLQGCRPYLAVDSTFLNGRFMGQLCIACAVDGHNWMYPVAIGVIDSETNENWVWFMERLKEAIGTPVGLTFSTDCGQAVMNGVSIVVPIVETSSASGMVFPHNEAMANSTHKKRKRKPYTKIGVSKRKGPATTTTSTSRSSKSGTGSNDPAPLQIEGHPVQTPTKKRAAIVKKLTPKRAPVEIASPESPASNTRSKKKLQME